MEGSLGSPRKPQLCNFYCFLSFSCWSSLQLCFLFFRLLYPLSNLLSSFSFIFLPIPILFLLTFVFILPLSQPFLCQSLLIFPSLSFLNFFFLLFLVYSYFWKAPSSSLPPPSPPLLPRTFCLLSSFLPPSFPVFSSYFLFPIYSFPLSFSLSLFLDVILCCLSRKMTLDVPNIGPKLKASLGIWVKTNRSLSAGKSLIRTPWLPLFSGQTKLSYRVCLSLSWLEQSDLAFQFWLLLLF